MLVGRPILTQEQLAAMIDVSRQTINSIEKGKSAPSTLLALKLCKGIAFPKRERFQILAYLNCQLGEIPRSK